MWRKRFGKMTAQHKCLFAWQQRNRDLHGILLYPVCGSIQRLSPESIMRLLFSRPRCKAVAFGIQQPSLICECDCKKCSATTIRSNYCDRLNGRRNTRKTTPVAVSTAFRSIVSKLTEALKKLRDCERMKDEDWEGAIEVEWSIDCLKGAGDPETNQETEFCLMMVSVPWKNVGK